MRTADHRDEDKVISNVNVYCRDLLLYFNVLMSQCINMLTGNRRARNRGRGQLLVGNSKARTLQFESDFDFETANAQFNKDELEKELQEKLTIKGTCIQSEFSTIPNLKPN